MRPSELQRDAIADAETLIINTYDPCAWWPRQTWWKRAQSDPFTFGRNAARAAFRAVPALRGE